MVTSPPVTCATGLPWLTLFFLFSFSSRLTFFVLSSSLPSLVVTCIRGHMVRFLPPPNSLKLSSMDKSASQAVLSRMQLIILHATRPTPYVSLRKAWYKKVSACSVKTRRASSRRCRFARVYRHTTTAMHDIEYTCPPPLHNGTRLA